MGSCLKFVLCMCHSNVNRFAIVYRRGEKVLRGTHAPLNVSHHLLLHLTFPLKSSFWQQCLIAVVHICLISNSKVAGLSLRCRPVWSPENRDIMLSLFCFAFISFTVWAG